MLKHTALLALAALPAAHADGHNAFSWVKSGEICAGIKTTCTGIDCTGVVIGECPNGATFPTQGWIYSEFVGVGVVNADTYLTGASRSGSSTLPVKGFRDNDIKTDPVSGNPYAYVMSGAVYGNMETSGAYVGIASYLNTGTGAISSNENEFYVAGGSSDQAHTHRGDSIFGAPLGPYRICVSDIDPDTGLCGAARTYQPGDYKFSVFGYTSGSRFDLGESEVDGATHIGVRMKLTVPYAPDSFMVNDGAIAYDGSASSKQQLKNADITNFQLTWGPDRGSDYGTCTSQGCPCVAGVNWPSGWGEDPTADLATIRSDADLAAAVDCVCRRCGHYPEIQGAATAGYCSAADDESDGSCNPETLKYSFPSTYNVGPTPGSLANVLNTGTATKNIKVKMHPVEGELAMYVDYLFEKADFTVANKYWVYDPDVTKGDMSAAAAAAASIATANAGSGSGDDDGDLGGNDATTAGLSVAAACALAIASLYHM